MATEYVETEMEPYLRNGLRHILRGLPPEHQEIIIELIRKKDEENAELREKFENLEQGMMKAGSVGVVRDVINDGKLVISSGRSDSVVGMADPDLEISVGDLVQTDINRMVAVSLLGCGDKFACDTAEFVSLNDDGTLTARKNGDLNIYLLAGGLRNENSSALKPGDLLLVNNDAHIAYRIHWAAECKSYNSELPPLVYTGSRSVLQQIEDIVFAPLFADASKRIPGSLTILTGPAGSGKSHSIKALAQKRNVFLSRLTNDDVGSSFVSETSQAIKERYTRGIRIAREGTPVVILIEEVNSLGSHRTGYEFRCAASQEFSNISSTLLTQQDNLVDLGAELPICVCYTTNLISELDAAIRSRASYEIKVGYIDREYGRELLAAHLEAASVQLAGGERDIDRLADILFDRSTPLVHVDARLGETRERFRLTPNDLMLPRLVSGVAASLKRYDSPVGWTHTAMAAHARLLAHANQVADSPQHYIPHADHPFAGDPDMKILNATSAYPSEIPREYLEDVKGR